MKTGPWMTGGTMAGAAVPAGVGRGQHVAVDTVDGGIDFRIGEVGEPAGLAGVAVLPCLDLVELLGPVDVGVAEQVVQILGTSPGAVGVGHVIGEDRKRRGDVGDDEQGADPGPGRNPVSVAAAESHDGPSGEHRNHGIYGKDVARANVHAGAHGNGKIDGGREDKVRDFAAPAQPPGDDGKHGQGEQREQAECWS